MGSTKGTTKSQGNKDEFDRFYTDVDEARKLLSHLMSYLRGNGIVSSDTPAYDIAFMEPSAGSGSFVRALEDAGYERISAYDIAPAPPEATACETKITCQDFLDDAFVPTRPDDTETFVAIGNPPFGTGGTLAFRFVAKCMESCDVVAFIMPPSACKDSAKSKTGTARMRHAIDVESDDYSLPGGDTVNVPSKFVIYTPVTDEDRASDAEAAKKDAENIAALPFSFTSKAKALAAKKDGKHAFTIRRVGGTAGTANDTIDVSDQSNYFCVMKDDAARTFAEVRDALAAPIAERDLSVGPRSLSRPEIARALVERLESASDADTDTGTNASAPDEPAANTMGVIRPAEA